MSDTTTASGHDPASEWSELLRELAPARRDAVAAALRSSATSGWPATRAMVISLIAYAQGTISAQEYAGQVMVALGYATDTAVVAARLPSTAPLPGPGLRQTGSRFDASGI